MLFFVDFDRTLLDWDGLVLRLIDICPPLHADIAAVMGLPPGTPERRAVWKKVADLIESGAFSLSEQDVQQYLYKDAVSFVSRHAGDIVIATSGDPGLQKIKLDLAFPGVQFRDVLLCGGHDYKGMEIGKWLKGARPEALFIDDAPLQLESVAKECPWIRLFEMCRGCKTPASRFTLIKSFDELEEHIFEKQS